MKQLSIESIEELYDLLQQEYGTVNQLIKDLHNRGWKLVYLDENGSKEPYLIDPLTKICRGPYAAKIIQLRRDFIGDNHGN